MKGGVDVVRTLVLVLLAVASLTPAAHAYDGRYYIVVARSDPPGLAVLVHPFDTEQQCSAALAHLLADPEAAAVMERARAQGFTVGCMANAVEYGRSLEASGVRVVWQSER